ncbi:hypothetical protein [Bacillus cereus]|uniref:hypothetical protein n=1 Tax=Bacillus cereus TaxID=1396 RepID=UPI00159677A6|nr:hypothetical protein [Bacillus cereus]
MVANFNQDISRDISPNAPFNLEEFKVLGDTDGTSSLWFGHGRGDAPIALREAVRMKNN